jgi:hypothetical protein
MIFKPTIESVTLADGMRWRGGNGWRYEEKLDGQFHVAGLAALAAVAALGGVGRYEAAPTGFR